MLTKKILIIGIDGGTWKILNPAIDGGHMPYLKSLRETGATGILESTIPAITPAAWGSFQTGMNPEKIGIFDFAGWDKKSRESLLVSSKSLKRTLWDILSDSGFRVGILNVPLTYPPRPINGYVVSGILTPSIEADFTYPREIKSELLKAVPNYHILNLENVRKETPHKHFKLFIQKMAEIVESRAKAACFIIEKQPLDVFMVHFYATDVVQHAMWCYLDKNHPLYNSTKEEHILKHFYKRLDQEIREVRQSFQKMVGDNFVTFIISDHGFQTHKKRFLLRSWLCQHGFLKLSQNSFHKSPFVKLVKKLDFLNLRKLSFLKSSRAKVAKKSEMVREPFVWEHSRAFSVGRSGEGFIYLLEEEKSKREATARELIQKLKQVKDPEDGTLIIKNIYRKEEVFGRKHLRTTPDLIVEPADGYSITGYGPCTGLFHKVNPRDDFHMGKHHKDGILVVTGEVVKKQSNVKAKIVDIVPTILYCLGLPIPKDIDGVARRELFKDEDSIRS
jgi:predicted AlkP superfamily phosphohydrolase/phosphomutase